MYVPRCLLPSYAHRSTAVEKKFPGDRDRLSRLSLIEGSAYLVIGYAIFVINVEVILQRASPSKSEWPTSQSSDADESMVLPNSIQTWYRKTSSRTSSSSMGKASSGTSQTEVCTHYMLYEFTRGLIGSPLVTPRRWLDQVHFYLFNVTSLTTVRSAQCNPSLSALITETLKIERNVWLKDLYKLEGLLAHVNDSEFQARWGAVKHQNKERLALFVERQLGIKVDASALFDVQIKRLHEYKRQTLNILGVIHVCVVYLSEWGEANVSTPSAQRYLLIKSLKPEERKKVVKKVVFFAGKAAPACTLSKISTLLPLVDHWSY